LHRGDKSKETPKWRIIYENRENLSIGIFFNGFLFEKKPKKRIKSSKFVELDEGLNSISGDRGRD